MAIHENIRQARLSAGLDQQELADKIGIKRSTYQYWEQKTPGIDKVHQVERALNLPKGSLLDENFVKPVIQEAPAEYKKPDRTQELLEVMIGLIKTQNVILERQSINLDKRVEEIGSNLSEVAGALQVMEIQLHSGREVVLESLARIEKKPPHSLLKEADKIMFEKAKKAKQLGSKASVDK